MLDSLQLGLDMLLAYLIQSHYAVVCFLGNHVQDVPEALGAPLTPCLVNPEGHVLSTFFPTKKFNISLALVQTFSIVKAWAWEDTNHLGKLYRPLG